jgi:hypothetical protein
VDRSQGANLPATTLASVGFLILVVGLAYFAMLVVAVHYAHDEQRAASYYELARYLSGRLEWYQDARVYGAASLLCALVSVLFGVHPLARVTIPVAGVAYVFLQFWDDWVWELITSWARHGP